MQITFLSGTLKQIASYMPLERLLEMTLPFWNVFIIENKYSSFYHLAGDLPRLSTRSTRDDKAIAPGAAVICTGPFISAETARSDTSFCGS